MEKSIVFCASQSLLFHSFPFHPANLCCQLVLVHLIWRTSFSNSCGLVFFKFSSFCLSEKFLKFVFIFNEYICWIWNSELIVVFLLCFPLLLFFLLLPPLLFLLLLLLLLFLILGYCWSSIIFDKEAAWFLFLQIRCHFSLAAFRLSLYIWLWVVWQQCVFRFLCMCVACDLLSFLDLLMSSIAFECSQSLYLQSFLVPHYLFLTSGTSNEQTIGYWYFPTSQWGFTDSFYVHYIPFIVHMDNL